MSGWIKTLFAKEYFDPSVLGLLINHFYIVRRGLLKGIKSLSKDLSGGRLLDVGCGSKPYRNFFSVDEYIGLDIEESGHNHKNEKIDVFYNGKTIPFENEYFDHVFPVKSLSTYLILILCLLRSIESPKKMVHF